MYIVVNSDLSMGKGKIAAQCCHAACDVTRILERNGKKCPNYREWLKDGETKVVLRATEKEILKLLDEYEVDKIVKRESPNQIWCSSVQDAGRTQIPAGSLTCVAFRPFAKDDMPAEVRKFKLL